MNPREKILAGIVAGLVGLGLIYGLTAKLFLLPAREAKERAAQLQTDCNRLADENAKEKMHLARQKLIASKTWGDEVLAASEKARARLTQLLEGSGLGGENLSLRPITGRDVTDVYKERGWSIKARGRLPQIVNFLYLLEADPRVHQLDNLSITPVGRTGEVDLQANYLSLVLEAPRGMKSPATGVELVPLPAVRTDTPERLRYELIAVRDIFRPYVPRPAAIARDNPPQPGPGTPANPDDPNARYKIVSLSSVDSKPDIGVLDLNSRQTTYLHPGDALLGGRIVMVDYRQLPLPDKPSLLSGSRVIVEVERELYAVELGQTLASRYRVPADRVPPGLTQPPEQQRSEQPPAEPAGG